MKVSGAPSPPDVQLKGSRAIGAVMVLVAVLCVLEATGSVQLGGWSELDPEQPYGVLFAAYLATWLVARRARGGARRIALLLGSLGTACLFDPWFATGSVAWVVMFHRVVFAGRRVRPGWGLAFTLATFIILAIACSRDLWPEFLDAHRGLGRWGYLFAISYTFRIAWLLHQVRMQRAVLPLLDVVLYFVFAPFFVIVPYMLAIPRCDRFCAGLDGHDPAIEQSGIRLLAWGVVLTSAAVVLHAFYDPHAAWLDSLRARDAAGIALHSLWSYPVDATLRTCAIAAILVGMVRVMGIELGPSFQRPLLATSIAEFWRRWNTHFRDLLVELFYVPVVMRLRRTPERAIVVGCIAVFVVGSTLFHLPKHYFRYGSIDPPNLHIVVENIVMCAIVAIALVREAREVKARIVRPPPGPLRTALRAIRTWIVLLVVVQYLGYGSQFAVFGERPPTAIQESHVDSHTR